MADATSLTRAAAIGQFEVRARSAQAALFTAAAVVAGQVVFQRVDGLDGGPADLGQIDLAGPAEAPASRPEGGNWSERGDMYRRGMAKAQRRPARVYWPSLGRRKNRPGKPNCLQDCLQAVAPQGYFFNENRMVGEEGLEPSKS
jgi:hypothetical protein